MKYDERCRYNAVGDGNVWNPSRCQRRPESWPRPVLSTNDETNKMCLGLCPPNQFWKKCPNWFTFLEKGEMAGLSEPLHHFVWKMRNPLANRVGKNPKHSQMGQSKLIIRGEFGINSLVWQLCCFFEKDPRNRSNKNDPKFSIISDSSNWFDRKRTRGYLNAEGQRLQETHGVGQCVRQRRLQGSHR